MLLERKGRREYVVVERVKFVEWKLSRLCVIMGVYSGPGVHSHLSR